MTNIHMQPLTGDYSLDVSRTRLGFLARHAVITKVHGHFTEFEGRTHVDLAQPWRSSASVSIRAASIVTGIPQRDAHLRSSDFLDVSRHPLIEFQSCDVTRINENTLRVVGDLTMRGVSRSLTLDFMYSQPETDRHGQVSLTFDGSTTISRHDWGLAWNAPVEIGGLVVSDKVVLELHVCVVPVASEETAVTVT